jgi:hypothetical protein
MSQVNDVQLALQQLTRRTFAIGNVSMDHRPIIAWALNVRGFIDRELQ